MNTPYAKVKMVIDGTSPVYGGQTATGNNVVQLSGEDTSSWRTALWEIYEYPDGFACPAGWTDINGIYQYYDFLPPSFTIPDTATLWGKFLFRLTVNEGLLDGVYRGPEDVEQPLVDEASAISTISPTLGLLDVAWQEGKQFDSFRLWVGALKENLRLLDAAALGGGGGEANTGANVGSGAGVFKDKSGVSLRFKSLIAGTNVAIVANANDLTISATGEANNGTNVGAGASVFKDKNGLNLRFKRIVAGANTIVTENTNDITIDSTGGANPSGTDGDVQTKNGTSLTAGYDRHVSNLVQALKPRVGNATPYASEGRASLAMADADQTVGDSVYSRSIIRTTGALTAQRRATMPHPASEDESYEKDWQNECTDEDLEVSTGTGTNVILAPGAKAHLAFTPSGVSLISGDAALPIDLSADGVEVENVLSSNNGGTGHDDTDLSLVPDQAVVVNPTGDGYDFAEVIDMPDFTGNGSKVLALNIGETALEFISKERRGFQNIDKTTFTGTVAIFGGATVDKYTFSAEPTKLALRITDTGDTGGGSAVLIAVLPAPSSGDAYEVTIECASSLGQVFFLLPAMVTYLETTGMPDTIESFGGVQVGALVTEFLPTGGSPGVTCNPIYRKKVTVSSTGIFEVPSAIATIDGGVSP